MHEKGRFGEKKRRHLCVYTAHFIGWTERIGLVGPGRTEKIANFRETFILFSFLINLYMRTLRSLRSCHRLGDLAGMWAETARKICVVRLCEKKKKKKESGEYACRLFFTRCRCPRVFAVCGCVVLCPHAFPRRARCPRVFPPRPERGVESSSSSGSL